VTNVELIDHHFSNNANYQTNGVKLSISRLQGYSLCLNHFIRNDKVVQTVSVTPREDIGEIKFDPATYSYSIDGEQVFRGVSSNRPVRGEV